ncbi:MAG TPA: hypothetical protein VLK84_11700 [Longimicrobium sp.]|nr:hypothetical protein [Longimicrobium sp.]
MPATFELGPQVPAGRLIAACTAFAAGTGPAPDHRTLATAIAGARRQQDGERLAAVALCAGVVTVPAEVIAVIGAVRDDYARCELFSDAIKMELLGVSHAVAAAEVMVPGECWRRNVLCSFLALDGAAEVLTWRGVHAALPEIGTRPDLNFVVVSAVRHGVLTDWSVAWSLAACADAMGQRDVACAAIRRGTAPAWSALHADLERMTPAADPDGAATTLAWLRPQPEEQRALVVETALEARLLSDPDAVAAEVRRALVRTSQDSGWHELTMLLRAARRFGLPLPDELSGEVDAVRAAKDTRDRERALDTARAHQMAGRRPRRRAPTSPGTCQDGSPPGMQTAIESQLAFTL